MKNLEIEIKENKNEYIYYIDLETSKVKIESYLYFENNGYDLIKVEYFNNNIYCSSLTVDTEEQHIELIDIDKENIIKALLIKLINNIGFNNITASLVGFFGYDIIHLMKKIREKNKLNIKENPNFVETIKGDETIYNILNYNCEYIAKIYINEERVKVEKNTNETINVLKIINKHLEKNNKPFIKILK